MTITTDNRPSPGMALLWTALKSIAVVIVAIISVGASEMLLIKWLDLAPIDITGHLFLYGILPVQFVVVGLATLLLWPVFAKKPLVFIPLYLVLFATLHALELAQFLNPPADIAMYVLAIALAGLCIPGALYWFRWRTAN